MAKGEGRAMMQRERITRDEYRAWQEICRVLSQDLQVVTADDLKSPVGDASTPGQQLLGMLRDWGMLRFRQGQHNP